MGATIGKARSPWTAVVSAAAPTGCAAPAGGISACSTLRSGWAGRSPTMSEPDLSLTLELTMPTMSTVDLFERCKAARRGRLVPALDAQVGLPIAADVAELVLCLVPEDDDRPRVAVEATRQWLAGKATPAQLWAAARAAEGACSEHALAGRRAAMYAAYAAWGVAEAAHDVARPHSAADAAEAARKAATAAANSAAWAVWHAATSSWVAPAPQADLIAGAAAVDPDVIAAIVRRYV